MIVVCSSPNHASRSAQPDWMASLGTADRQVTGMLCGACARLDPLDPTTVNQAAIFSWLDTLIPQGENAVANWSTLSAIQKDAAAKQVVQAVTRLARLVRNNLASPGA